MQDVLTPIVSIVVPTYRRPSALERFLTFMEPQVKEVPGCRVIVVNDGSHDTDYERVLRRFKEIVHYVALPRNVGPAVARNLGAKEADSRFVLFSDDDCAPPSHWLTWLLAQIEDNPGVAVFGGTTRLPEATSRSLVENFNRALGLYPRPLYRDGELFCLPSANIAIDLTWFEQVGGFDERFHFAAGEDVNLAYRLKLAGAPFLIDLQWYTQHDVDDTLPQFWRRWYRYGFGNAQHLSLSSDKTDFYIYRDMTLAWIAKGIPNYIRYVRNVHAAGIENHWAAPTEIAWRPFAFGILTAIQWAAYRLGGRRGFAYEARRKSHSEYAHV